MKKRFHHSYHQNLYLNILYLLFRSNENLKTKDFLKISKLRTWLAFSNLWASGHEIHYITHTIYKENYEVVLDWMVEKSPFSKILNNNHEYKDRKVRIQNLKTKKITCLVVSTINHVAHKTGYKRNTVDL